MRDGLGDTLTLECSHWGHARLYAHLLYAASKSSRLSHSPRIKTQQTRARRGRRTARRSTTKRAAAREKEREMSENGEVIARFRVTSRAEGIQIEERSMTLEICIAINNEAGVRCPPSPSFPVETQRAKYTCVCTLSVVRYRILHSSLSGKRSSCRYPRRVRRDQRAGRSATKTTPSHFPAVFSLSTLAQLRYPADTHPQI